MTINTHQSHLTVPLPLNFEGEYSFDDGETWQVLTASSDLSTDQGDLLLRGHFDNEIFPGGVLYLYRDHFGISVTVDGELIFRSVQSEILSMGEAGKVYLADTCGREWTRVWFENGLQGTDTVEIHLQKMHDYIDPDAYRYFLDSFYVGPTETMIVEAYLQSHVAAWTTFGRLILIIAVMLLSFIVTVSDCGTLMIDAVFTGK
jgi:hypothetical protein